VGHVVVNDLLTHWPKYADTTIGGDQAAPHKP
jgi:hypothetical protein